MGEMRIAANCRPSLDAAIGDEESDTLAEIVEDEKVEIACEMLDQSSYPKGFRDRIVSEMSTRAQYSSAE
jgi:hypothetical protein